MVNPYVGQTFFYFFVVLGKRLLQMFPGGLFQDEVQVIVLILIALSSSLVGSFLVLKKVTMLANSLSHTILLGIVAAFVLLGYKHDIFSLNMSKLFISALIAALCTTFSTQFLHKKLKVQEDASIGLVFTAFLALGVIFVTLLSRNSHLGIEAVMGNVDALHRSDVRWAFYLCMFNIAVTLLFFRRLEMVAFDATLAKIMGISLLFFDYLMMFQIALTAVGAFRAIGAFLFLSFLVSPVLTARFFTCRLKPLLVLACVVGIVSALMSVSLSRHVLTTYHLSLSTSGLSSVILGFLFLIGILYDRMRVWH